jgi:hypothetical protein
MGNSGARKGDDGWIVPASQVDTPADDVWSRRLIAPLPRLACRPSSVVLLHHEIPLPSQDSPLTQRHPPSALTLTWLDLTLYTIFLRVRLELQNFGFFIPSSNFAMAVFSSISS